MIMSFNITSVNEKLSKPTSFLGIRLRVLILGFIVLLAVVILSVMLLCIIFVCSRKRKSSKPHLPLLNPISCSHYRNTNSSSSLDRRLLSQPISEIEMNIPKLDQHNQLQLFSPDQWCNQAGGGIRSRGSETEADLESFARYSPVALDACGGNRFALRDIEVVTNWFVDENVIGSGDHGVVYRGVLLDTSRVAIKRLSRKSCQAEVFAEAVEVIGNVRHRNLVKMLGYCTEGNNRLLVSEYVDNGNLHQWLHMCPVKVSPLTWGIRTNIIQGIAKGLAYLHEDVEPRIIHGNLKSSNILLDHQWNPKISDFGINRLFGPDLGHVIASSMESSGYLSREHASAGVLNERSDVYNFGILVMEITCGRPPVDHHQPQAYLINWLKSMIANQNIMYVADPKLPEMPSSKELKRILLLALRCVDVDTRHRPTMGDVIHILKPGDLLLNDECQLKRDTSLRRHCPQDNQTVMQMRQDDSHERPNVINQYQKMIQK